MTKGTYWRASIRLPATLTTIFRSARRSCGLPFCCWPMDLSKPRTELGFAIPADGFSRPYRIAMAAGTAFYGFLGLLLSYDLSRRYFAEKWAFLATLAIWFASSLPVYMYFNPSWSHAHSAFAVSLFLWYWSRTLSRRSWPQWAILGALSGLMINVYYLNAIFLVLIVWEAVSGYATAGRFR